MDQTCSMVVIDDIKTVVNGIVNQLNWAEHGIEIAGTATDGEGGLALLRRTKPDIIVTDIRMPKLSGIEMTRQITELLPGSKIIFISGYSDFDNAQQAVKLGAFDYVLKPFTSKQFLNIVLQARDSVLKERADQVRLGDMERKLKESIPLLRQEYLNLLVRYAADPSTLAQRWDFLQIDLDDRPFAVFAIEIDRPPGASNEQTIKEIELNRFAVQNIAEETILASTKGIVFRDGVNRFIAIVNVQDPDEPLAVAERCLRNVARFSKCTISIGVGQVARAKSEIPLAYRQSVEALSYNFYTGGNSVFDFRDIEHGKHQAPPVYSEHKEKELLYSIRSGNSDKAEQALEQIFMEWDGMHGYPSPDQTKVLYFELALAIQKAAADRIARPEKLPFEDKINRLTHHALTIRDMQRLIKELCSLGCGIVESRQREEAQRIIDESKRYMKEHLHVNESVADYAKRVHLSPSYFANLFKKVTGQAVMQFVLNERMERAKLLLAGNDSIQEVAEAVGYEDRSYFSEVFKKQTGMTPKDFKLRYAKNG
ncbi:response regulator [Paenibacillus arenilitoris]|uniref:Response regulator n=1 Tax=Paenibacillus arenilitoris TaxID=2772299 RepID=A0A927H5J1_9BACL|nr:response regulator [Paenibacillus arenilitoris]MBD2868593.1 response regulator [Paenibacillus arenilitoris]